MSRYYIATSRQDGHDTVRTVFDDFKEAFKWLRKEPLTGEYRSLFEFEAVKIIKEFGGDILRLDD